MYRSVFIMVCLLLMSVVLMDATAAGQKIMSVQVKKSQLRAAPSYLGKVIATVSYGDRVTVTEERGDWKKVLLGRNTQGWIHSSALTGKQIALKAGQANVESSVSQSEIALAGKGFSKEVEAQYQQKNKSLDYTWINRMEAITVSPNQMEEFVTAGRLTPDETGGRP
jgi:SH3-like domain-containing protein